MARRIREVGMIKAGFLGAVLLGAAALPAHAADLSGGAPMEAAAPTHDFKLSANVALTTDYMFRGISQTLNDPALQGGFDLTYNIFYAGIWASNVDFGSALNLAGNPQTLADLEIDYYAGLRPVWKGITFDMAGLYYTYPSAFDPAGEFDYFELKTAMAYTFAEKLTLSLSNYWSPDNFAETGDNDVLEFGAAYAFANKIWMFTPTVSGIYGHQWGDENDGGFDYNYWNAGLTLGFYDKPAFSIDVRYWDTDAETVCGNFCDERVVGTLKAVF